MYSMKWLFSVEKYRGAGVLGGSITRARNVKLSMITTNKLLIFPITAGLTFEVFSSTQILKKEQ